MADTFYANRLGYTHALTGRRFSDGFAPANEDEAHSYERGYWRGRREKRNRVFVLDME